MGCKSSFKREIYSNTILPQETRKTSKRQPNLTPKANGENARISWVTNEASVNLRKLKTHEASFLTTVL